MARRDTVHFEGADYQADAGKWTEAPFTGTTDPPAWLSILGVVQVKNLTIPWSAAGRDWKVRGSFAPLNGAWVIKFRASSDEGPGTLFTPVLNVAAGTFEMDIGEEYLVINVDTWVWFEDCTHAPQGHPTFGVLMGNALKIAVR